MVVLFACQITVVCVSHVSQIRDGVVSFVHLDGEPLILGVDQNAFIHALL